MSKKPKYPLVMTSEGDKDIKKGKGKLKSMSPKAFLDAARPLHVGKNDRKLIDSFKGQIQRHDSLGQLKLYKDGKEDGRHRATASKELGVAKVPVIDYRKGRAEGGLILEDRYPTHYMPHVGRQVMQQGGEPQLTGEVGFLEDDQQAAPLPTFAQPQAQEVTQALDVARAAAQPKKEYAPFGVLPLKETDEGIEFDPYAGLLGTVTRPFKYFTETMSGQKPMDPTSDEAIRAATDLAGAIAGGATAFERPRGALASGPSRPGMGHNMPPEPIAPERVTNPLGMHSHAAEVARNLPQQKGTIEQMLAMIRNKPGVNPEEFHWSGIEQAFQPGQKVTGEEIASHFESKLPQVQETMYGGAEHELKYGSQDWSPQQWQNAIRRAEMNRDFDRAEALMSEWETSEGFGAGPKAPKYPDYVTPGGTNYREIVLHHPPSWKPEITEKYGRFGFTGPDGKFRDYWTKSEAEQAAKSFARGAGDFTESHHNEPNILGHLRMSDMQGPSGEKILNVHEFQSDWGQKARTHGVLTGKEAEDKATLIAKRDEVSQKITDLVKEIREGVKESLIGGGFNEDDASRMVEQQSPQRLASLFNKSAEAEYLKLLDESSTLHDDIAAVDSRKPAAPYVTSREGQHNTPGWTDLLIKRVMQEAEKGNYDKVVWDTPREQGARYHNMPKIVKGMEGYYGDVLPRRFKKVVPNIKLGEHRVGAPQTDIDFSLNNISDNVPGADTALWAAKEEHPDLNNMQLMRKLGIYDDFMIVEAAKRQITLPEVVIRPMGEDMFAVIDEESGATLGSFAEREEADAAANNYLGQMAEALIKQAEVKRPGFEMTPELKEHVRKGLPAYREGGEVEGAIHVAKNLR